MATGGASKGGSINPTVGMAPPAGYGVNPYDQAAQGQQQAFNTANQAMGYNNQYPGSIQQMNPAMMYGAASYNPTQLGNANTYTAAKMNGTGYDAAQMTGAGYNAAQANAHLVGGPAQAQQQASQAKGYNAAMQNGPASMASLMDRYMNPYQDQVVDRTQDQLEKQRLQMQDVNRAEASAAGAFGGSRHGLTEATTNAEISQQMGDIAAQLNMQGFNTANQFAGQDIANTMQVGAQNQNAQNAARQFGAGAFNQNSMFNAGQSNALSQYNASNRFQNQVNNQNAANQFGLANQNALNAQRQYNAGNQQQASMQNQAATNAQRQYGAANQQQANMQNQAAINAQRGQYANSRNQFDQYNQQAMNQAGQYNAGNRQQQMLANQASQNQASQYNAGQYNSALQQQIQNALSGSGAFGNLAGQSLNMGNTIAGNQMNAGAMGQAQQQALMQQAQQMYQQYASQPENILQMRLASLGMNPLNNTGTTTTNTQTNPGWGATAGNLLGAAGNMFSFSPISLF